MRSYPGCGHFKKRAQAGDTVCTVYDTVIRLTEFVCIVYGTVQNTRKKYLDHCFSFPANSTALAGYAFIVIRVVCMYL